MGSYSLTRFCSAGLILHVCRFDSRAAFLLYIITNPNQIKPIINTCKADNIVKSNEFQEFYFFSSVSVSCFNKHKFVADKK